MIWARQKPHPFWPAKLISVDDDDKVNVWFFGAHKRAVLTTKDCFMYSEAYPSNRIVPNEDEQLLKDAKEVIFSHLLKRKSP